MASATSDARAFCLCCDANPTMSGKHVFYRIFAELGNVFQAGEFAVRGRWARSTLTIVDFPLVLQGLQETISGHVQVCGRNEIAMAGMSFSQGFSMVPGHFLRCADSSTSSLGTEVLLGLLFPLRFSKVSWKPSARPEKISLQKCSKTCSRTAFRDLYFLAALMVSKKP